MNLVFLIILISGLTLIILYRFVDRKKFMGFDMVGFIYAFFFSPLIYFCLRYMFFVMIDSNAFRTKQFYLLDMLLNLILLFAYAGIILHLLTKEVALRRIKSSKDDILRYLERIHLVFSHLLLYLGGLLAVVFLGGMNLYYHLVLDNVSFVIILICSCLAAISLGVAVWLSNFTKIKFLIMIELVSAISLLAYFAFYLINRPSFTGSFLIFWAIFAFLAVFLSFLSLLTAFPYLGNFFNFLHHKKNWKYNNFQLFE